MLFLIVDILMLAFINNEIHIPKIMTDEKIEIYKRNIKEQFEKAENKIKELSNNINNEVELNVFVNDCMREFQKLIPLTFNLSHIKGISFEKELEIYDYALELSSLIHNSYSIIFRKKLNKIKNH